MKLTPEAVSTQVIPRDRYAAFFAGFEIISHTPHEFWITRYPPGLAGALLTTVGITSGASVPEILVRGVLDRLAEYGRKVCAHGAFPLEHAGKGGIKLCSLEDKEGRSATGRAKHHLFAEAA